MAESFGVKGRGRFYEETGIIRDVIQNHLLQVVSYLAMEAPSSSLIRSKKDTLGLSIRKLPTMNSLMHLKKCVTISTI